jgi:predicted transcriptional regulator
MVSLPAELDDAVQRLADQRGIKPTDVIREAVGQYVGIETRTRRTVADVATEAIRAGATNREALETVRAEFGDVDTSLASISWYRSKLRQQGEDVRTDPEVRRMRERQTEQGAK